MGTVGASLAPPTLPQRLRHWWLEAPNPDPRVDQTLARAYIRDLRDTPITAGFTALVFWLLFAWLTRSWGTVVWAVLIHSTQLSTWRFLHSVQPEQVGVEDAYAWLRRLEWRMLRPGLVWALAPWLFFPRGDLTQILLMYFFVSGVASVVIAGLAPWWLATLCFGVPVYLSISLRLMVSGEGTIALLMGALALLQLLTTLHNARKQNRLIVQAIDAGLENARLADALQAELGRVAELAAQRARVFAAANHDLRQPLHALAVFVESLRTDQPVRATTLRHMQGGVDALRASIDGLLDIAQLDRGALEVSRVPVRLNALFDSLEGRFAPVAQAKGLWLRMRPTRAVVLADAPMLLRLVGNLVDNALKYTPSGGVLVAARPVWRAGRPGWRIEVRDSGIGIAPAQRARIFEEFYQVDNPGRDRSRGLGLGLALVASMARSLGSSIVLRSAPGRGSTFALCLDAVPAPAAPPLREAGDESALPTRALRILVLDDEAPVREGMRALLQSWGHEVALAASPREALQQPGTFDLLLSDLRLGEGLSGLAAARTLEGLGKARQVAVITGETAQAEREQVQAAGFMLLYKPVPAAQLRAAIGRAAASPPSLP